jgi:hypothetical protein
MRRWRKMIFCLYYGFCPSYSGNSANIKGVYCMKIQKHFIFGAILSIFVLFTACDDGNEKEVCVCPNGSLHLVGEICCNTGDCNCTRNVAGQRLSNGIPVTNRDNAVEPATFNTIITDGIEAALNDLSQEEKAILKNWLKEIRIIAGPGVPSHSSGVITIRETGWSKDNIYTRFDMIIYPEFV